jgi:TM2 domain-containing membrane protein YozV
MTGMSKALTRRGRGSGIVPAVCSFFVPGVGQLVNGETDKAIGVFATWGIAGLGFIGAIPIIGPVAGLVAVATTIYAVGDAYVQGRRKG